MIFPVCDDCCGVVGDSNRSANFFDEVSVSGNDQYSIGQPVEIMGPTCSSYKGPLVIESAMFCLIRQEFSGSGLMRFFSKSKIQGFYV